MADEVSKSQLKVLHGLRPEEYEHPLDRIALNALEGTPGLENLIRKFNQYGFEKICKFQYTGSNIKVTSKVLPEVHEILLSVCQTINLKQIPSLYIQAGVDINAFAIGSEKPIIVLNEATVDKLSPKELTFVIGHEIGHIKSQHMVYKMLSMFFPLVGGMVGTATLGISEVITAPINFALNTWSRKAEFSCDRAGLLACQDIDAAVTAFMKIAGAPESHYHNLDPKTFIDQAKDLETNDEDKMDKVAKFISLIGNTHPWTVVRCAELSDWIDSDSYYELLTQLREPTLQKAGFCKHCGKQVKSSAKFCIFCGSEI
jgi:Zn-dependent protease with chaperone function